MREWNTLLLVSFVSVVCPACCAGGRGKCSAEVGRMSRVRRVFFILLMGSRFGCGGIKMQLGQER